MDTYTFSQSFCADGSCEVCVSHCDNSRRFLVGHKSRDDQHPVKSICWSRKTHSNKVRRQAPRRLSTFKLRPKTASLPGMHESHLFWSVNNRIVLLAPLDHPRMTGNLVFIPRYRKVNLWKLPAWNREDTGNFCHGALSNDCKSQNHFVKEARSRTR